VSPNVNAFKPWEVLDEREVYVANPWIKVTKQKVRLPDGSVIDDYHQIKLTESVVIYAETDAGQVIVERSYRHGAGQVTLLLPAGQIELNETPLEAARRELLEETGYTAEQWQTLGSFTVHGNYGCGRAHIFHARQARLSAEPNSGDLEGMEILLMSLPDLMDAVDTRQVCTMGTLATITLATSALIRSHAATDGVPDGRNGRDDL
jgi:ADP-ribose pyrophosphatase